MYKCDMKDFKEMVRSFGRMVQHEGAPRMYRADMCAALNHFWKLPANAPYNMDSPGFHISRVMEEVANEEGWVFAWDTRPNGSRYGIRFEFPGILRKAA